MLDLAAAVETALQEPRPRITVLDIGGGLSANYGSDEAKPTHAELCAALRQVYSYSSLPPPTKEIDDGATP